MLSFYYFVLYPLGGFTFGPVLGEYWLAENATDKNFWKRMMQTVVLGIIVAARRTYWGEDNKKNGTKEDAFANIGKGCPGFERSEVTLGKVL
jgi:hypothetical protein